jgi:hypothetical protein
MPGFGSTEVSGSLADRAAGRLNLNLLGFVLVLS